MKTQTAPGCKGLERFPFVDAGMDGAGITSVRKAITNG